MLTNGAAIYPHRPDLKKKAIWECKPCGAYVGCHPNSTDPLGYPANGELRRARSYTHRVLDPLWRNAHQAGYGIDPDDRRALKAIRRTGRTRVYEWLAHHMGLSRANCHVGMFDIHQCRTAYRLLKPLTPRDVREWAKARRAS